VLCAFKLNKNSGVGRQSMIFLSVLSFLLSSSSSSSYSPTAACCRHRRHRSSLLFFRSLLTNISASFKQVSAYIATTYNCLEVKYAHMHAVFYVCVLSLSMKVLFFFFFCFVKIRFSRRLTLENRSTGAFVYIRV
jgi:hypothetical protein